MVSTSPPYWNLRDYGLEAQIWGGDPNCVMVREDGTKLHHDFSLPAGGRRERQPDRCTDNHDANGKGIFGDSLPRGAQPSKAARGGPAIRYGDFCECGAWRGSLGLEPTPDLWVEHLVEIFREVRRVLRSDGTLWLNCGDAFANDFKWGGRSGGKHSYLDDNNRKRLGRERRYTGLKPKDLIGLPWMLAFALRADGWWLRSDIIYHKPAPMPESVTDRPTRAHEMLFLLAKSERYFYDFEAIKEPASPGTHARLSQANLHKQNGGEREKSYREDQINLSVVGRGAADIRKSYAKKNGVNPKARKRVSGWQEGPGSHSPIEHARGQKDVDRAEQGLRDSTKFGRGAGWREKQNESFAESASGEIVLNRNKRSVWTIEDHALANWFRWYAEQPEAQILFDRYAKDMRNKPDLWTITTEPLKDAHYAAYPTEIVRPCVMAGTSEYGCCPKCGAPWERIVLDREEVDAPGSGNKDRKLNDGTRSRLDTHLGTGVPWKPSVVSNLEWRPTCRCANRETLAESNGAEFFPVPCRVLDPFNGSGTTGIVALGLGREYIGIELKLEYVRLAEKRITEAARLLNRVEIRYEEKAK